MTPPNTRAHWDRRWSEVQPDRVSWYEPVAATSVRLIVDNCPASALVIDVGAGRSPLAADLLERGYDDVTVLDVSDRALDHAIGGVHRVVTDLLSWHPTRRYGAWHDRAVFHFFTDPDDQARYRRLAADTVGPGGVLVLATFAPGGPDSCSGLPVRRWDAAELATFFAPTFTTVHSETANHETPTGTGQPFTWVVLRRTERPDPDTENQENAMTVTDSATGCGADISPADTLAAHTRADADVIDVREPDERDGGHVEGTRHIALADLDPSELDPQRPVITICRSGGRSGKAADKLAEAGFTVRSMSGGLNDWQQRGMPLVRDDGTPGSLS